MTEATQEKPFEQLVQRVVPQSRLLRTWELKGGVSAQVTALEVERADGQRIKMVVRRHGATDLNHNPDVAQNEFKLLHILQSEGLPTPTPYHLDQFGTLFASPVVVLEYVEGEPDFAPSTVAGCVLQMAAQLVAIHRVDASKVDLSFLPQLGKGCRARPAMPETSSGEGCIRDTLESLWPLSRLNEPVLLHGDFWPGNLLWKDGRLVAVIDWEDARVGDPLVDVANGRLEILWAFGIGAMEAFTHHYESMTRIDFTNLPYWDLCAALRTASKISEWGLDESVEQDMREGHRWFVEQALQKLQLQV